MKKYIFTLTLLALIKSANSQTFAYNSSYKFSFGNTSTKFDNQGNIIRIGTFYGVHDFDKSTTNSFILNSATNGAMLIQKLDPNGNLIWATLTL